MEESILISVKKYLGISSDYLAFDEDIMMHINAVFMALCHMGVGPEKPFFIEDESATWDDFSLNRMLVSAAKPYIYLRVRQLFDPPQSSAVAQAMTEQMKEYEWRMYAHANFE